MDLVREERLELEPDVVVRERERASLSELLLFVLEDIAVCLIILQGEDSGESRREGKTKKAELQASVSPKPFQKIRHYQI